VVILMYKYHMSSFTNCQETQKKKKYIYIYICEKIHFHPELKFTLKWPKVTEMKMAQAVGLPH
jgi:hypothetical protein